MLCVRGVLELCYICVRCVTYVYAVESTTVQVLVLLTPHCIRSTTVLLYYKLFHFTEVTAMTSVLVSQELSLVWKQFHVFS